MSILIDFETEAIKNELRKITPEDLLKRTKELGITEKVPYSLFVMWIDQLDCPPAFDPAYASAFLEKY